MLSSRASVRLTPLVRIDEPSKASANPTNSSPKEPSRVRSRLNRALEPVKARTRLVPAGADSVAAASASTAPT